MTRKRLRNADDMPSSRQLRTIVSAVEQQLAQFYDFQPQASAVDHLINQDGLRKAIHQPGNESQPIPRGGVWLTQQQASDDLFISIHFHDAIASTLAACDPIQHLDRSNLDAFCVLVEELSHFHLILNRAARGRSVSQLELEWQGEIDKLLISALVLKSQYGHSHFRHLAKLLFDESIIQDEMPNRYQEANHYAARFWYNLIGKQENTLRDPVLSASVKAILRSVYWAPWSRKVAYAAQPELLMAS